MRFVCAISDKHAIIVEQQLHTS